MPIEGKARLRADADNGARAYSGEPGTMDAIEPVGDGAGEPKGRRAQRGKRASAKPETAKRSLNLRIDDDVYERLTVHAMKRRMTISDLVGEMTRSHCRDFAIHKVGQRGGSADEQP